MLTDNEIIKRAEDFIRVVDPVSLAPYISCPVDDGSGYFRNVNFRKVKRSKTGEDGIYKEWQEWIFDSIE